MTPDPNIALGVDQQNKHKADLLVKQIKVAKKVVRDLKNLMRLRLIYGSHSKVERYTWASTSPSFFGLNGYRDSIYAVDHEIKS